MGKQWCGEFSTIHFFLTVLKEASAYALYKWSQIGQKYEKAV